MAESATPGWVRLTLQVPDAVAKDFRQMAASTGTAGVKYAGTAAIAAMLAMSEHVRDDLLKTVVKRTWANAEGLDIDEIREVLLNAVLEEMKNKQDAAGGHAVPVDDDPAAPRWQIVRILDPELTPPPGQKASDKAKDAKKKSG